MITLSSPQELLEHEGVELGASGWRSLTDADLTAFRAAVRVRPAPDPDVVDGDLVIALLGSLLREVFVVERRRMAVNYGLERVRHVAPVRVGDRIRAHCTLARVELIGDSAVQAVFATQVEAEDAGAVVCEAQVVVRYVF